MNTIHRHLLQQVMRERAACGLLVRLSWFIAACVLGLLIFYYYVGKPVFGDALMLCLVSGLAYLWCGAFLKNAVQQNWPSNAVLVPGLRRGLMQTTVILYSAATLLTAAMSWLLTGHPGYGLLAGGLFSIYVLSAQRYSWMNFVPSVVIVIAVSNSKHPMDSLLAAADVIGEPLVTAIGVVLLALLGGRTMQAVFPRGGDRHFAWHRCYTRQLARANGSVLNLEPGNGMRWLAWLRLPYTYALRADSRRGADQGRQMLHVLGTPAHDGGAIAYAVVSTIIMSVVVRYIASKLEPALTLMTSTMMQGMLMMSVLVYAANVAAHAARFSGEQGLYRLTPAAPATAQINRVLLGTLLFRCLRLWLISTLAIICIDAVAIGQFEVRGITFALASLMLPFAGLLMRDFATVPARPNAMLPVVTSTTVVLIYVALAVAEQMQPGLPLFWFGGVVMAVTVIALRLRWQRLLTLPPLLPASRLAA
jgi:hypothetical protein